MREGNSRKGILRRGSGTKEVPAALWVIIGIAALVLIIFHTYNDILITAKQSMNFWNLLFAGRPLDFYKEAVMISDNPYYTVEQHASYLFPLYLVFAVWNLPTWLISRFAEGYAASIPAMIWMKLMLVPFALITANYIVKIVKAVSGKKQYSEYAAFLFLSSLILMYSTEMLGQYDIISTMFVTMGIYYWQKKDDRMFIIMFAAALTFKYFALLYFLPLLVLRDKNVLSLVKKGILVFLPSVFFMLVFRKPEGQGSNVTKLAYVFFRSVSFGDNCNLYIFPLICLLAGAFAYFKRADEKEEFQWGIFYTAVIMIAFCTVINPLPYWCILSVPVIIIAVIISVDMKGMLLLEAVLGAGVALKNYALYFYCFGVRTVKAMGLAEILFGKCKADLDIDYSPFLAANNQVILSLLYTGLTAVFILMVYYMIPSRQSKVPKTELSSTELCFRTAVNLLIAFIPLALNLLYMY